VGWVKFKIKTDEGGRYLPVSRELRWGQGLRPAGRARRSPGPRRGRRTEGAPRVSA